MTTIDFAGFDMDSGYVYARQSDGNIILINCTAYERAYADNMYERSELDYLIYNDPVEYIKLILDDKLHDYLRAITDYTPLYHLR